MQQVCPYINLQPKVQKKVIAGAGLLWFYNLLFGFTMPVVLPSLMEQYDIMAYYAIMGGITSLVGCIVTPIGGKLGDRFGRRRVCLLAGYLRLALMLFCAIPTNGPIFFVIYVLGNLVGGFLNAFPATILSDVTTPEERPRWFGLFGTINGAALLIGLLGGGIVVDLLGPGATFLFFSPFGLSALILLTQYYPNVPSSKSVGLDPGGMVLLGFGTACVLAWCAFGDILFPRMSALGLALLIVGILLLIVLLRYEQVARDPLFNLHLFQDSHFTMSFTTHLLIAPMMCLCSSVLALYGQVGLRLSATVSGTLALPKNILFFLLPSLLGALIAKDQTRFRTAFLTCGGTITAASLISATWSTSTSVVTIYLVMLLFGIGTSCQSVCVQPYMQATISPTDMGVAASMVQFANSVGVVIFNAFYNVCYNVRYSEAMLAGGGEHLAQAVSETFSDMSLLSAATGAVLIVFTLCLVKKKPRHVITV